MKKRELAYNLICNADNDVYAEIINWLFGGSMIELIMEQLDGVDDKGLDKFIKKFGNKSLLNNKK